MDCIEIMELRMARCFLHIEDLRLGFEHAVGIDELSEAYPLLDVIDHTKSRAAVCIVHLYCVLIKFV